MIFLFEFSGIPLGIFVGGAVAVCGGVATAFGCVIGCVIVYRYRKNKKSSGI